ncbi:MAG: GSCFA domain-containing protein [Bacteroidota bacterium]
MQFHLNYKPAISVQKITHQDQVLMIGSCFSQHIGNKLNDLKFKLETNPFGMVFNPESIVKAIIRIVEKKYFTEEDVFVHDEQWICLESHSSVSAASKEELLNSLNRLIDVWHAHLKTAPWLTITFGTAYAYKYLSSGQIVANCHKLPQAQFEKILLEPSAIISAYRNLLITLGQFNPNLKVIFTVSPVKHLRDGVVENSLSKAILLQCVHQIIKGANHCFYFPAYEIVTDDLRDYRFFESDMAHPNKLAIDYVWKLFGEAYFNEATQVINEKVMHIHQAYNHRLINKATGPSVKFRHNFYQKCVNLQAEYPYLDLVKELNYFNTIED